MSSKMPYVLLLMMFSAKGEEWYRFSLLILIFLSLGLSLLSSSGHDAQLSWSVSNVGEQIRGYVVLYKPKKDRKAVWNFKRTLQHSQTTLTPLQYLTNYTVWVLCYTTSGKVYGSNTIYFGTTRGTVSSNERLGFFFFFPKNTPKSVIFLKETSV